MRIQEVFFSCTTIRVHFTQTDLHFDVADKDGFDQEFYQTRIEELRSDIRVVAFKKFCSNEPKPDDVDSFKERYETDILPNNLFAAHK
ncbi:hypothetical protein CN980_32330, partial [Bacillus cereus]